MITERMPAPSSEQSNTDKVLEESSGNRLQDVAPQSVERTVPQPLRFQPHEDEYSPIEDPLADRPHVRGPGPSVVDVTDQEIAAAQRSTIERYPSGATIPSDESSINLRERGSTTVGDMSAQTGDTGVEGGGSVSVLGRLFEAAQRLWKRGVRTETRMPSVRGTVHIYDPDRANQPSVLNPDDEAKHRPSKERVSSDDETRVA